MRLRHAAVSIAALGFGLASTAIARPLWAEPAGPRVLPVAILEIDSDDAEDQAEALTSALRSRIRAAPGYSLTETSQTLSALVIALRCPRQPDPPCLQRIGDQLKVDRFVWGTMGKGPAAQTVSADVHLWTRGKSEAHARESYSDNLKDPGDESLRRLATRVFDKLTGAPPPGALSVQSTAEHATVLVDGAPRGVIEKGQARIELSVGPHDVEVRAPNTTPATQSVQIASGGEIAIVLVPTPLTESGVAERPKPFPTRQVVGWGALGLGAVSVAIGVVEAARFLSAKSALDGYREKVPSNLTDVCSDEAQSNPNAVLACREAEKARGARALGFVFGGVGLALAGVGAYVLATAPKDPTRAGRLRILPAVGPSGGGVDVAVRF